MTLRTFLAAPWLRSHASLQGVCVRSLIRELTSHPLHGAGKKKKKTWNVTLFGNKVFADKFNTRIKMISYRVLVASNSVSILTKIGKVHTETWRRKLCEDWNDVSTRNVKCHWQPPFCCSNLKLLMDVRVGP